MYNHVKNENGDWLPQQGENGVPSMNLTGSQAVAATEKIVAAAASPEPLGMGAFNGVIRAKDSNTVTAYLGDAATQNLPLQPGQEREVHVSDLAIVFARVGVDGEGFDLFGGTV